MEPLNNYTLNSYNMNAHRITIWFFRLMLLIVTAAILLVFVLSINDTVSIKEGEIMAANPQNDYIAPFEGQLLKINLKEGQKVRTGDTLLILKNTDYVTQQAKKR